uniref:Cyclic nucleotide-binding domain-containing protein n=1 Tax=Globodera pallida TaxID=36090 RepID=A0A183BMF1_GLOPA
MNPRGVSYHCWTLLVTIAFLYNALTISMLVFAEFNAAFYWPWILLNFATDLVNLADMVVQTRKGVIVSEFIAITEHNCPWPLSFRLFRLGTICYLLFHWNACLYFFMSTFYGYENSTFDSWTFSHQKIPDLVFPLCDPRFDVHRNECLMPETDWRLRPYRIDQLRDHWANRSGYTAFGNLTKKYAMSFYWSALTLVTLGEQPWPENSVQSMFEIVDTLIGLLVFAAIIGDVGIMVSRAHLAKANFQEFVDGCKLYMQIRHVNQQMHDRVIKWVEYQWMGGVERAQPVDENNLLNALPPRLARELAAEFHLNALIRSPTSRFVLGPNSRAMVSYNAVIIQSSAKYELETTMNVSVKINVYQHLDTKLMKTYNVDLAAAINELMRTEKNKFKELVSASSATVPPLDGVSVDQLVWCRSPPCSAPKSPF